MGLTWVGVTAVAAQLTESARGTAGFALGALAVAYMLRALGDAAGDDSPVRFLTWLSPLGWGEMVQPYGANRTWLLLVGVLAYAVSRPRRLRPPRASRPRRRRPAESSGSGPRLASAPSAA